MKWITRRNVKVDRVACPWLIKRFIDAEAESVFLPVDTDWASLRDGIVYDVPECELGHHGEDVSFNSFLKKYGLTDPALALLGEIVRAADSHPSNPHPAGEGLHWVAHGFSALGLSDAEILKREFVVYDALYAECRRRTQSPATLDSPSGWASSATCATYSRSSSWWVPEKNYGCGLCPSISRFWAPPRCSLVCLTL
jgi:hypothetical protein